MHISRHLAQAFIRTIVSLCNTSSHTIEWQQVRSTIDEFIARARGEQDALEDQRRAVEDLLNVCEFGAPVLGHMLRAGAPVGVVQDVLDLGACVVVPEERQQALSWRRGVILESVLVGGVGVPVLQLLLDRGVSLGEVAAVHVACKGPTTGEVLRFLLDQDGVRVGDSPLLLLAKSDADAEPAAVHVLVDAGADLEAVDEDGSTALALTCQRVAKEDLALELLAAGASPSPSSLVHAVCSELPRLVQALLEAGADANPPESGSPPPLIVACMQAPVDPSRVVEVIRLLVDAGASTRQVWNGISPLAAACWRGHGIESVSFLLQAGSEMRLLPGMKFTCLCAAASSSADEAVLRALVAAGSVVCEGTPTGKTCLDVATRETTRSLLLDLSASQSLQQLLVGTHVGGPQGASTALTRLRTHALFDANVLGLVRKILAAKE